MKFGRLYISILALSVLIIACGNQQAKETEQETMPTDTIVDTIGVKYEGPPPIVEEPKSDSPFFAVGCCNETEKRMEDCCCLKVLEEYVKLRKSKPISYIVELKMNDVI